MRFTHQPYPEALVAATQALTPVSLAQLDQAQLHDRVESKVILAETGLPAALGRLSTDYLVMEHEGERFQHYHNSYFDTQDLRNYHAHHNGNGSRLKIRYRTYANSELRFFEVKRKANGRTTKERRKSSPPAEGAECRGLSPADAAFFFRQTGWRPSVLEHSVSISYDRILLVKQDFSERVTIDLNLTFAQPDLVVQAPGLAIVEFKQPRLDRRSPAMKALAQRPQSFSKYCIGLASCDTSLRRNRFKRVFRQLDTLGATPTSRKLVAA